jgi:nicotinate phosphoribosyltransferase
VAAGDVLSLESDCQDGEALILPVMRAGRRTAASETLADIRARAACGLERLPEALRRLEPGTTCGVQVADALKTLAAETDRRMVAPQKAIS